MGSATIQADFGEDQNHIGGLSSIAPSQPHGRALMHDVISTGPVVGPETTRVLAATERTSRRWFTRTGNALTGTVTLTAGVGEAAF